MVTSIPRNVVNLLEFSQDFGYWTIADTQEENIYLALSAFSDKQGSLIIPDKRWWYIENLNKTLDTTFEVKGTF